MCIAIYKPEDIILTDECIYNSFYNNNDGAGFMFSENDQLYVKRGYFDFDDFCKEYEPHKSKKCILHFRIKTSGQINEENCHPFKITEKLAFVHNGIIYRVPDHKEKSDTCVFNDLLLKNLGFSLG